MTTLDELFDELQQTLAHAREHSDDYDQMIGRVADAGQLAIDFVATELGFTGSMTRDVVKLIAQRERVMPTALLAVVDARPRRRWPWSR